MPVLYSGMDKDFYPGDEAMSWLRTETNLRWTGYYLPVAGPGLASKKTWGGTYSTLRAMHWGIAPLYVGEPRNSVKLAQNRGRERRDGPGDDEVEAPLDRLVAPAGHASSRAGAHVTSGPWTRARQRPATDAPSTTR